MANRSGFVYLAALITSVGSLLFGYDTGVISGAILFVKAQFQLNSYLEGVVVSSVLIGALLGAASGGYLADALGRRRSIMTAGGLFTLGAVVASVAPNAVILVIGRVVTGLGVGLASFTSPLYIAEISPSNIRGKLVSLAQFVLTVGIVVAYIIDFALAPASDWRAMFGIAVIPGLALLIGMYFMPESPRWLIDKGHYPQAVSVLEKISDTKQQAESEVSRIEKELAEEKKGWRELLAPEVKPMLVVGIALAIFQQVTGINTVIYYAPTIFQLAGFVSASAAIFATVGVGVVNVLVTLGALFLIDRVGRRPLLEISLSGMAASLVLLALAFSLRSSLTGPAAALSLMAYVGFFAVGLGPVFWLLISEIYPLSVRGLATSVAALTNWLSNFFVALTFLLLVGWLGKSMTFLLYAVLSISALAFVLKYVPETKDMTLEAIQQEIMKRLGLTPAEGAQPKP
ncbi:MAG: sugar porter family MFS transporter [Thermoprotei archaeon]|nr:sugar porter family MFS transporter [TACK group archaeon]